MIDKEFTFIALSAVMEDSNNIKVTVTSNNESDLNKIKALDTIGGAIDIEYNTNSSAKIIWLVTPYNSSHVRTVNGSGSLDFDLPYSNSYGARPSVNLKSTILIQSE